MPFTCPHYHKGSVTHVNNQQYIMILGMPPILFPLVHWNTSYYITQFLGCVLWDHLSGENNPLPTSYCFVFPSTTASSLAKLVCVPSDRPLGSPSKNMIPINWDLHAGNAWFERMHNQGHKQIVHIIPMHCAQSFRCNRSMCWTSIPLIFKLLLKG